MGIEVDKGDLDTKRGGKRKKDFPKVVKQVWKEKSKCGDLWGALKEKLTNS